MGDGGERKEERIGKRGRRREWDKVIRERGKGGENGRW